VNLAEKKVLVTGADGFIGSHLVERLVARGAAVRALVLYNSFGHRGWLDTVDSHLQSQIEIVTGDIRDPFRTRTIMRDAEIVFHLASLIAIPYSYHAPESYVATNVSGTLNLLQAALDERVGRFVHVSTSEVYGSAQSVPMNEQHPLSAQSPYAASKIAADQLALSFQKSYGLPVTLARPFNTYGPRQSARAIIPTIITQALLVGTGKSAIHLGSTSPRRDFTYVTDTADGLIATAECDGAIGETINLGSGTEISIGDLAAKIIAITTKSVSITTDSRRLRPPESEVDRLLCDNAKAAKLLGWKPTMSLDDGLRRTIDWFSIPGNLSKYRTDEYTI
jgi:NAD dependent epimerase/dehydratase